MKQVVIKICVQNTVSRKTCNIKFKNYDAIGVSCLAAQRVVTAEELHKVTKCKHFTVLKIL